MTTLICLPKNTNKEGTTREGVNAQVFSFPPASAVEGIKSVPSVCVCVCVSVSALMAEPFDIQNQNLVEALTLIIFRMSLKVKVIGQRSRSPG